MKQPEFDLAIIGGGIVGCSLFSQAVLEGANAVLLEADNDVSAFATKANSGIVHSGYDPMPNTKMAKFNIRGNEMYPSMCERLGVQFMDCGTLTVATEEGRERLQKLLERGKENGVHGLRIIEKEELFEMEPNLADHISIALYAPTGGVISPYSVCIALAEEGVVNGGKVLTDFEVDAIQKTEGLYVIKAGDKQVTAKYVVNCAGPNANEINALLNAKQYPVNYVKGEYLLLDKSQKGFVNRSIFPLPSAESKGIVVNTSTHGNIIFGPTAVPCEKNDVSVSQESIDFIKRSVSETMKNPNFKKVIKLFAGVRVKSGSDFVIEKDDRNEHFYYAIGICSPGLTAAPAIAEDFMRQLKADGLPTKKITPQKRVSYLDAVKMNKKDLKDLIKKNPAYGKVVCRCEQISEGEIVDAINSPLHPYTIDAIKRRVRPTMGRCQGSFCIPKLIKIFAAQKKIKEEQVTLDGSDSELLVSDIKKGGRYEK